MTTALIPGSATLADWRAILAGSDAALATSARAAVDAGRATIDAVLASGKPVYGINTGFGKLASIRIGPADLETLQRNLVLSHASGVGAPIAEDTTRLILALKAASLAQGASGVRWIVVERLLAALARGLLPIIPGQGSVGASGDLAPLAHMVAALFLGVGEARLVGTTMDAADALARAGLPILPLAAKEGLALLNGTQVSTALALTGLFAAERLLQAGLITGALATDAARGSDGPFDARIQTLRRHRGQAEAATALRALMDGSAIRASHVSGDERLQDPYCLRCQPQVMGACLDLLRQAATTLALEANAVTDNPLVFAAEGDVVSGGNFHAEPVAFAADMIALALCEIGSIAERRVAMLTDPALSGLPAFLTRHPGLNSGFMLPQVTAAALVAENRQMSHPASVDSLPTSANQEDHVSMATQAARRLIPMASNLAAILGIELLAAAQGCDFHAPLASSPPLERVRATLRAAVPTLEDDRYMAADMRDAIQLVASGAIAVAAGVALPTLKMAATP